MTDWQRPVHNARVSLLSLLGAVAFFLLPSALFAKSAGAAPAVAQGNGEAGLNGKATGKRMAWALDEAGNVMVRYRRMSLTFIYGPNEAIDSLRERAGLVPPVKESAGVGDLSVRLGVTF